MAIIVFFAASLLVLLVGATSSLASRGIGFRPDDPPPGGGPPVASSGMRRFKELLRAREWTRVLPSLLITAGILGVMVWGAIGLAVLFDQKVTGLLMLGVAIWAIVRVAREYRRA